MLEKYQICFSYAYHRAEKQVRPGREYVLQFCLITAERRKLRRTESGQIVGVVLLKQTFKY